MNPVLVAIIILENSSNKTFIVELNKEQWICCPGKTKSFPVPIGDHNLIVNDYGDKKIEIVKAGQVISIDLAVFVKPKTNQAIITVYVPKDIKKIYFDEVGHSVEKSKKEFITPNKLVLGKKYYYIIRCGKEKREVMVEAGAMIKVDFRRKNE
jgi:hypothetical protein